MCPGEALRGPQRRQELALRRDLQPKARSPVAPDFLASRPRVRWSRGWRRERSPAGRSWRARSHRRPRSLRRAPARSKFSGDVSSSFAQLFGGMDRNPNLKGRALTEAALKADGAAVVRDDLFD